MKQRLVFVAIPLLLAVFPEQQATRSAFGALIHFSPPPAHWQIVLDEPVGEATKGAVIYKRDAVLDGQGRQIEPHLGLVYELLPDSMDAIIYSINKRGGMPPAYQTDSVYGYPDYTSHPMSIVFQGHYELSGTPHTVYVAYYTRGRLGIQIILDATEGVFQQVEADARAFIKSVTITDEPSPPTRR